MKRSVGLAVCGALVLVPLACSDAGFTSELEPVLDAAGEHVPIEASASFDAGLEGGDAEDDGDAADASVDGSNATDAAPDASDAMDARDEDAADAGDASDCDALVSWYPDDDLDGYGRDSAAVQLCAAPQPGWVTLGGDCNDDNPNVHPGQAGYFIYPYVTGAGSDSFDYDCSGGEEPSGSQLGPAPDCGALAIGNCGGQGFVAGPRSGSGQNPYCGSTTVRKCVKNGLFCEPSTYQVAPGKACR